MKLCSCQHIKLYAPVVPPTTTLFLSCIYIDNKNDEYKCEEEIIRMMSTNAKRRGRQKLPKPYILFLLPSLVCSKNYCCNRCINDNAASSTANATKHFII